MTPTILETMRLQVYLARAGVASRRASEGIILEGRVRVNGIIVRELGTKVSSTDHVEVDGRLVLLQEIQRYLLLNKPAGYICAMSDPQGRPLAIDLIAAGVQERIYNVGRLDQWSSGLVIFTNDGGLAARLSHPSGGIEKEYSVLSDSPIEPGLLRQFCDGIEIDGIIYRAKTALSTGVCSANIVLVEGKNREIRTVLKHFGLRALALRRIRIGPIKIGELKEGSFRDLATSELSAIKASLYSPRDGRVAISQSRRQDSPRH